jgi:hypothetical protein
LHFAFYILDENFWDTTLALIHLELERGGSKRWESCRCAAGSHPPAATDQVEDEDDDGDNDENVDEASADMKGEAEKPQNHKNDKDCPEHELSFAPRAPGKG